MHSTYVVRPRVLLAPLQIGLGVQLHHHYASHFIVDSLHHLGFCYSYQQVQEFEQSAAFSHGTDIPNFSDLSIQYIADNVDHTIRTLDGNNTLWDGDNHNSDSWCWSNNCISKIEFHSGIWQQFDEFQYGFIRKRVLG